MRIPAWMLVHDATVKPYTGSGAYGSQYGDPYDVRCRVEPRRDTIAGRDGSEVLASGRLFAGPDDAIPDQSEITHAGVKYDVVRVDTLYGPQGEVHHQEVWLR